MNAVYQGYHNRVVALKGKNGGGWLTMADQCGRCRGKLGISISLSSGTMAGQWVRIKACGKFRGYITEKRVEWVMKDERG